MAVPCIADTDTIHLEQDVGSGELLANVILDTVSDNLLSESAAGLLGRYAPPLVSSLPASPYDGQVVMFDANDGAATIWQLRYNAASSSSYKWEWVGGGFVSVFDTTVITRSGGGGYGAGSGSDVQVGLPGNVVGDYWVEHGARINPSGAGVATQQTAKLGAAASADANSILGSNANVGAYASQPIIAAGMAASDVIILKYASASGSGSFSYRWLKLRPIRLAPA